MVNKTKIVTSKSSWLEILEKRSCNQPEQTFITYLPDGETAQESYTYKELTLKAKEIAAVLQARCSIGDRALLVYHSGIEFLPAFLGCLLAGVIAVPLQPFRGKRNIPKISAIIKDSNAALLLTTGSEKSRLEDDMRNFPLFMNEGNILSTDLVEAELASDLKEFKAKSDTIAFLQYTSGTTSEPKGVMVTHSNLLYNSQLICDSFQHSHSSVGVIWLPHYHDMGLIGGLLQPLYSGFPVIVMPPECFLQKPVRWLQAITKYKATTSGGPNFAYELCMRKISSEQRESLNLKSWDVAFIGAEPLRSQTMQRFCNEFAGHGFSATAFMPCYGLAEATLAVTVGLKTDPFKSISIDKDFALNGHKVKPVEAGPNALTLISSGIALGSHKIAIIDPENNRLCLKNSIGEIWVSGGSLAAGYWNRKDYTKEIFQAHQANDEPKSFLRTGDYGFILNGELFVTGRLKDMIIIRGMNYFPRDIEDTISRNNPDLNPDSIVAFAVDDGLTEKLIIAMELERTQIKNINPEVLISQVLDAISEQELAANEILILKPGSLPKTSSGKIQRHLTSTKFLKDEFKILHAWSATRSYEKAFKKDLDSSSKTSLSTNKSLNSNQLTANPDNNLQIIEEWLAGWIQKKTGCNLDAIKPENSFIYYGMDSIAALELQNDAQQWLNISIPASAAWECSNICELAKFINGLKNGDVSAGYTQSKISNYEILRIQGLEPMDLRREITGLLSNGVHLWIERDELLVKAPEYLLSQRQREMLRRNAGEIMQLLRNTNNPIYIESDISQGQEGVLFHYRLKPNNDAYNIKCAMHINGQSQTSLIEKALNFVVDRRPSLRAMFVNLDGGRSKQRIFTNKKININVVGAYSWSAEEQNQYIDRLARQPFNLEKGEVFKCALIKKSTNQYILLFLFHHIALDFWSLEIILREFSLAFKAILQNEKIVLPDLSLHYTDFVNDQRAMIENGEFEDSWAYWKNELNNNLPVLRLPSEKKRPQVQTFAGSSTRFPINNALYNRLKTLAQNEDVTLFALIFTAYAVLLHKYTGLVDVIVGTPVVGRNRPEYHETVGYFTNIVPLRIDLSGNPGFIDILRNARQKTVNAFKHQHFPFPLLVKRLKLKRDSSIAPIFQVSFTWERVRLSKQDFNIPNNQANQSNNDNKLSFNIESLDLEQKGALFDLDLSIVDGPENCFGIFRYNTDIFTEQFIGKMTGHMVCLLESIAALPSQKLSAINILAGNEMRGILFERGQGKTIYEDTKPIHVLFEEQVEIYPDKTAVVFNDCRLSYDELNRKANKLAGFLQKQRVGFETLVPVCLERSESLLVALIAVLKAGGAYLPLDPTYPKDRLEYMINQAEASVILTQESLQSVFSNVESKLILLDQAHDEIEREKDDNPDLEISASQLCYVIFTSGSTGKPKGISIEHKGVSNCLISIKNSVGVNQDDTMLAVTSISFDIAVLELFMPLFSGATVIIADRNTAMEPGALTRKMKSSGASIMQATPSTWKMIIDSGRLDDKNLTILSGGEELPPDLAQNLINSGKALWNLYGPTETTIWSSIEHVKNMNNGKVAIGRPLANTILYVLDNNRNPVPDGVAGELYIGGEGLAREYYKQPALTDEKFVPNPYSREFGGMMFKTGDMARYLENGILEYLGRIDLQVKVRGYRIELEEIEQLLRDHSLIVDSAAIVLKDQNDNPQIIAFIIFHSGKDIDNDELRSYLRKSLPDYMIPTKYIKMDSFPLTLNGKLDRAKLAKTKNIFVKDDTGYKAASTPVEQKLLEIWEDVLKIENISVDDNFFELGGASHQAMQMIAIAAERGFNFDPEQVFQYQTISELAKFVEEDVPSQMVIESLGVYLPEKTVTFKEVLAGCNTKIKFPLRRLSGIESVRMAAEDEFAIDLAEKAIESCFQNSKYKSADIDLLISCNITRFIALNTLTFEPAFSVMLAERFKMNNAFTFDISNACTSMFTGLWVAQQFIKTGHVKRAMVVSGEHITGTLKTSQKEIEEYMDSRLACLTLGDAGAAVIVEASSSRNAGFHDLELYTRPEYSRLCIAEATEKDHGGIIMYTDLIGLSNVSTDEGVKHSKEMIDKNRMDINDFDHLILHQTSKTTLTNAIDKINKCFGANFSNKENTINNITHRGNTATTTHFVALWDNIHNNRINNGDKIIFGISGSGITTGTSLYVMDDLPDRIRSAKKQGTAPPPVFESLAGATHKAKPLHRVAVESVGIANNNAEARMSAVELAKIAGKSCFAGSEYKRPDIELLIYTGVYRDNFLCEPAMAAMVAGDLKIGRAKDALTENNVLVFDIFNGAIGFLYACYFTAQSITAGSAKTAMVVAGEIDNNAGNSEKESLDIKETASAIILGQSANLEKGFNRFIFKSKTGHIEDLQIKGMINKPPFHLDIDKSAELEKLQIDCLIEAVNELLENEELDLSNIKVIIPPQISSQFISNLAKRLKPQSDKFIDVTEPGCDLFTSSVPYAMKHVFDKGLAQVGDIGLIMAAGSGAQACCASYYF